MSDRCPCGTEQPFDQCCGPFLSAADRPATPEQLMRSRFTAYVRGDARYLLATWFPATAPRVSAEELLRDSPHWRKLEVLAHARDGDRGTVEFRAWYTDPDNPLGLQAMHEISEFVRLAGRWLYVGGRVD